MIIRDYIIRDYKEQDTFEIAELFTWTVRKINSKDYDEKQIDAWAPVQIDYENWLNRLRIKKPLVVLDIDKIIGFAEFEQNGHIDCFYVHFKYQNRGAGKLLLKTIENKAGMLKLKKIYAEVSKTAIYFFEKHGFTLIKEQRVEIRGISLTNYRMEKSI